MVPAPKHYVIAYAVLVLIFGTVIVSLMLATNDVSLLGIVLVAVVMPGFLVLYTALHTLKYDYLIGENELTLRWWRTVIFLTVPYAEITEVVVVSWNDFGVTGLRPLTLKSRIATEMVVIRRSAGVFRSIVITPADPHFFTAELRGAVARARLKSRSSERG